MNLATNAYHAMRGTSGKLRVSLKEVEFGEQDVINPKMKPGVYACLIVSDTGMGMDKDLEKKYLTRFSPPKKMVKVQGWVLQWYMVLFIVAAALCRLIANQEKEPNSTFTCRG